MNNETLDTKEMQETLVSEAEKGDEREFLPFFVWAQSRIGLLYCFAFAFFALYSIMYANGFFDMMFKICILGSILVTAGKTGIFSKTTRDKICSDDYVKSMSEFISKSTLIVLLIIMLLPVFENTFEEIFAWKYGYIIFCFVILILNCFFARLKRYTEDERKYLNIIQLPSIIGFVGSALFFVSLFIAYNKEGLGNIGEADTRLITVICIVGIVCGVLYTYFNLTKMACVSHHSSIIVEPILATATFLCIGSSIFTLYSKSFANTSIIVMIMLCVGPALMLISSVIGLILEKKSTFDIDLKRDVKGGKADGTKDLYRVWESWRIKKWNFGSIILVLLAFVLFNVAVDVGLGYLLEYNLLAVPVYYISGALFIETDPSLSMPMVTLILVALIKGFMGVIFIKVVMDINDPFPKEEKVPFFPTNTAARVILATFLGITGIAPVFYLIPFYSISAVFMEMYLAMMVYVYIVVTVLVLMYYRFTDFMLLKSKAGKAARVLVPHILFLISLVVELSTTVLIGNNIFPDYVNIFNSLNLGLKLDFGVWMNLAVVAGVALLIGLISGSLYMFSRKWYISALPLVLYVNAVLTAIPLIASYVNFFQILCAWILMIPGSIPLAYSIYYMPIRLLLLKEKKVTDEIEE